MIGNCNSLSGVAPEQLLDLSTSFGIAGIMKLTFFTETGHSYIAEIDPQMELENIMALLEAEVIFESKRTIAPDQITF